VEIKADFDPGVILKHLDKIERQAEELRAALPVEMADWQNQDLNRKHATTRTIDVEKPSVNFTRAATTVNPTSKVRIKRRRRLIRRIKKAGQHERIRRSNRPVLRASLLVDFKDRFRTLLDEAF
jgi:hypothetical protein